MGKEIPARAVVAYLPTIMKAVASIEADLALYPDLVDRASLHVLPLEKETGGSNLTHAMRIMNAWLEGTKFKADPRFFHKLEPGADWNEMVALLNDKAASYGVMTVTEITLDPSGRISRNASGTTLSYDLADDGLKLKIIEFLVSESGMYIPTAALRKLVGSKSAESVLKTVSKINSALKVHLRLPEKQKFIETKRGTGHRINPAYNIVRTSRT